MKFRNGDCVLKRAYLCVPRGNAFRIRTDPEIIDKLCRLPAANLKTSAAALRQTHSATMGRSTYVISLGTRIGLSRFGGPPQLNAAVTHQNGHETRSRYAGNNLAGDCN